MLGPWTHRRSRTSGARSQMQGRCHHPGALCPGTCTATLLVACQVANTAAARLLWCGMPCRMYATAAARGDGLLLLCGGRDAGGTPLGDAYGFARHRDGRWEWHAAPGAMPTGRYQHGAIFVGNRLHISGGAVGGGRMVSGCTRHSPWLQLAGQGSGFDDMPDGYLTIGCTAVL